MNKPELVEFGRVLKGLFPTVTDEQGALAVQLAQRLPYGVAIDALKTHANRHEFLVLPQFRESLRSANDRARLQNAAGWLDGERRALPLKRDTALLDGPPPVPETDDELAALKAAVIAEQPESSRPFLERSDPRTSKVLVALIARHRERRQNAQAAQG